MGQDFNIISGHVSSMVARKCPSIIFTCTEWTKFIVASVVSDAVVKVSIVSEGDHFAGATIGEAIAHCSWKSFAD